jgi:hypothetical protein
MRKLFFCLLILFSKEGISQPHINYTYDDNGNRVQRDFVPLRLANTQIKDSTVYHDIGISVFPNPVYETFHISVNSELNQNENINVLITDANGKKLYFKNLNSGMNNIDFSNYKSGIYFVKIELENEIVEYKIIKL